ncbi:hypothetical protein ABPG72_011731 [Tetrahymena utriculariae]
MLQSSSQNKQGNWIEKLKEILKEQKIEEEEENSQLNCSGNDDIQNQNSNTRTQDCLSSQSNSQNEVSFLENDNHHGKKEQNKVMYQKVAEAFYQEQSYIINDHEQEEEHQQTKKLKQELEGHQSFLDSEDEFDKAYNDQKNKESLDIVQMNDFDRIKQYQDHTIFQKIYKKIWYTKVLTNWVALSIINHPLFEVISLGVIIFNSILLSLDDPTTNNDNNYQIDQALLIIYTVEMGLKIIALGFIFNKGAYLRDTWNIIDIVIIITGFMPQTEINLSALRSLRVLRPLKSITKIKALKQLIQALLSSIPLLKDSIIILSFFFIIFGIAGLQLFTGQLKSRCIDPSLGVMEGDNGDNVIVCTINSDCADTPEYTTICSKTMVSPFYDTIQFDTFGWSVLNVYVIVSLEGWTQIMNLMQSGFSYYSVFYFFFVVYIGSFFLMNLTMAIIGVKYTESISNQQKGDQNQDSKNEVGYNIKDMIEWGIYKSNKVYYKELEEEKKKQHSLFGFTETFGMLADKFKSLLLKQSSSEKTDSRKNNDQQLDNFEQVKENKMKINNSHHLIPQLQPQLYTSMNDDNIFSKQQLIEKEVNGQESQQNNLLRTLSQAPRIPIENIDNFQINFTDQPKQKTLVQGGQAKNLRKNRSKLLSKKISKVDNILSSTRIVPLLNPAPNDPSQFKQPKFQKQNNMSTQIKKASSIISQNCSDQENQHLSQINEEKVSNKIRSNSQNKEMNSNQNELISPQILQDQLDQISSKDGNQNQLSHSKKSSQILRSAAKHKSYYSSSPNKNYKQIVVGDRTIHLAPIYSKNSKFKQNKRKQTIANEHENMLNSKRLNQNMLQSKRMSQMGGGISQQRDSLNQRSNEDSLLKIDLGTQQEFNKDLRRKYKRINQIPSMMLDSVNSSSKRGSISKFYDSVDPDQFAHDDFLKEIELKEKILRYNEKYKENDVSNKQNTDAQIENSYASSKMTINQLKSRKVQLNDNLDQTENYQVLPNKLQQENTRTDKHEQRQSEVSSEMKYLYRRDRKNKSKESVSNSIQSRRRNEASSLGSQSESNQRSKTKSISAIDQLSEESDMSMAYSQNHRRANKSQNNSITDIPGIPQDEIKQTKPTLIFNDAEFLKIFGKQEHHNRGSRKHSEQYNKKTHQAIKPQLLNDEPQFKRQETRKIDRKYYANVDEKLDMKKEEMKLLLNSKILKPRVILEEPNEYTEDIQPLKKQAQQEKRKAEQHKKLKNLRFVIKYFSQKKLQKQKQSNNQDLRKLIPYKRSTRIDDLNKEKLFIVLENPIIDDTYSKNQSINLDRGNNFDSKSYHSQKKQHVDDKIKGVPPSHNIIERIQNQEGQQESINQALSNDKNQENNLEDVQVDSNPAIQLKYDENTLDRLKSKKSIADEIKKQDSIESMSQKKHQYSSTKPLRLSVSMERGGKKKKVETEMKWEQWDYHNALNMIFYDIDEEEDEKKQKLKKNQNQNEIAHNVDLSKSLFSSSTYRRKDSRFSEGSESMLFKSSMIDESNLNNTNNSITLEFSENKSSKKSAQDNKINSILYEEFEKELIEYDYVSTRKKEILNLEKKGQNLIKVDWSGDAVIPSTIAIKEQKQLNLIISKLNRSKYDMEQNEGGFLGLIQALRRRIKYIVHSPVFENSIIICVIINTIILSLDGIVTDEQGLYTISQFNISFTYIFALDMFLKIIGDGFTEYVSDKMNIFDCIIVCLSLFELFFIRETGSGSSFSAFRAVRILRVFRVLRVTRLVRSLQFMKLMITAIGSSLSQFIYILLLLFLFMFIYTLLGMSLFGGSFNMPDKPTRMNFDSFLNSAFAILQLLTLENWNNLLQICIRSNVSNFLSVLFLISWMFIGNYIFMNLVLAIIMDSFDSDEVQADRKEIENRFEVVEDIDFNYSSVGTTILAQTSQYSSSNYSNSFVNKVNSNSFSNSHRKSQTDQQSQHSHTKSGSQNEIDEEDFDDVKKSNINQIQFVYFAGVKCQRSLYIFSQQNIIRKICYRTLMHPLFEQVVLMVIVLSSIKLTMDTYVNDQESQIYIIGLQIDKFFTAFFALESLIKIISLGLIFDSNSYLRDTWSQLDFFIVICSIIDVSVTSINLSAIKILRLLRTLRPLRLLNHNKSMKLIVTALMESVGGITNMIMVLILIWLMFAILALNLMKGKMHYCNPPDHMSLNLYAYNKQRCLNIPGAIWDMYDINCDNIGTSMLFLFILSSFEGWPDYVWSFIDGSDDGPILNNSGYFAFFFAVFIFVGGFFSINLFSAIMSFNFDIAQKKAKNKYLTDEQSQWIELQRMIVKSTPDFNSLKKPTNKIRYILWQFVRSSYVEIFIIFCILCNIVTMAMVYDTSPQSYDLILNDLNIFFTSVFITEAIIKIIAFGPQGYFFNGWNQFDFFVVCASIVDIVTIYMGRQLVAFLRAGPQIARVLRVLRVSRLLKLIKSFQNLQKLIQTTIFALPHLLNATALFLLFYFIFAILGCYLFSSVNEGKVINQYNNFKDFHSAFIVLFRCSTGEDWMIIMFDVVKGTSNYSIIYFVIFIITQTYMMMNLFVLIIINQFEENYIDPDNPLQNFTESEKNFKQFWGIMTEKEQGIKIHERFLTDFYFQLEQPLGYDYNMKKKNFVENLKLHNCGISDEEIKSKCEKFKIKQRQEADKHIMQMNIYCDYEGYIFFNELFFYFFKFSLRDEVNDFPVPRNQKEVEKQIKAIQILRKEENITFKRMNYIKKKQSQLIKQKINKKRKEGVNPMVRRLFVGMCFQSWKQYSKNTQKKIHDLNFNHEDISSQSETESDSENEEDEIYFLKNDKRDMLQFRKDFKKKIIAREHTIFTRPKVSNEKDPNNLYEKERYVYLPNTDIYKDEYVLDDYDYYRKQVFQEEPNQKKKQYSSQDSNILNENKKQKELLKSPTNQSIDTPINFQAKDYPNAYSQPGSQQKMSKFNNQQTNSQEDEYEEAQNILESQDPQSIQLKIPSINILSSCKELSDEQQGVSKLNGIQSLNTLPNKPRSDTNFIEKDERPQTQQTQQVGIISKFKDKFK